METVQIRAVSAPSALSATRQFTAVDRFCCSPRALRFSCSALRELFKEHQAAPQRECTVRSCSRSLTANSPSPRHRSRWARSSHRSAAVC